MLSPRRQFGNLSPEMNPNSQDEDGKTPLYRASKQGDLELVKELLEKGADPNLANIEIAPRPKTDVSLSAS